MAHFAELDENNVVLRVIVVSNADTSDAHGVEKEYIGAAFCERLFGGRWKQTSYNGNFRKRYAGMGYTYNELHDAFLPPKPYPSWVNLDPNTLDWIPPVPEPAPEEGKIHIWDELTRTWVTKAE
jgi:hypothetical protein